MSIFPIVFHDAARTCCLDSAWTPIIRWPGPRGITVAEWRIVDSDRASIVVAWRFTLAARLVLAVLPVVAQVVGLWRRLVGSGR